MDTPIDKVLAALPDARPSGDGWSARCPAHDDTQPSLSATEGDDGRVLLYCHAGCTVEAVAEALGMTVAGLFGAGEGDGVPPAQSSATVPLAGLTLDAYAAAKALPVAFLRELGLGEIYLSGTPVVKIPYRDSSGSEQAAQFRMSMDGGNRFRWRKGSKPIPYGLDRLAEARAAGWVVIVEGPSDAQTLWYHGIPAIGVPGAATWRAEWAVHLDGIDAVYLVVEPDTGGEALRERLGSSVLRERLLLVTALGAKDPSELHVSGPGGFPDAWRIALEAARPWSDAVGEASAEVALEALGLAGDLVGETDLLERFAQFAAVHGLVVGEEAALKVLYLAITSRLLEHPVSVVVKGPSAAGKSHLVKQVLAAFPPEAQYAVTAMSERALAYGQEPLGHRVLVIYEAAGLTGDFGTYLLRSLLSEGRVAYETVEKTGDGLRTRLIEREGPTGLILTTTELKLHPENETRMLSIPVTDTPDQTRSVMMAIARRASSQPDLAPWRALQIWLAAGPLKVVIPFAPALAGMVRPVAVRLRRDFGTILSLVEAHALLHRAVRDRADDGATVATVEDYAAVHALVSEMISEGIERTVPQNVRDTVAAVEDLLAHGGTGRSSDEAGVTAAAIGRYLDLDKSAARRRALDAVERGYLENLETRPARHGRYVLADALPDEVDLLPEPEALARAWGGEVAEDRDGPDGPPADLRP